MKSMRYHFSESIWWVKRSTRNREDIRTAHTVRSITRVGGNSLGWQRRIFFSTCFHRILGPQSVALLVARTERRMVTRASIAAFQTFLRLTFCAQKLQWILAEPTCDCRIGVIKNPSKAARKVFHKYIFTYRNGTIRLDKILKAEYTDIKLKCDEIYYN